LPRRNCRIADNHTIVALTSHADWPTENLLLADVVMAAHPKVIEPLLVTHWCSILLEDNIVVNSVFISI